MHEFLSILFLAAIAYPSLEESIRQHDPLAILGWGYLHLWAPLAQLRERRRARAELRDKDRVEPPRLPGDE